MNIVDIIILLVLGLSLIAGMYKGFVNSVLMLLGFFAAVYGAYLLYPAVVAQINSNAFFMNTLSSYLDAGSRIRDIGNTPISQIVVQPDLLTRALDAIKLPPEFANLLKVNIDTQAFAHLGLSNISSYVSQTLIDVVLNVIAFFVLFFAVYFIINLVLSLIDNVFHFPQLKWLDALLGGAFGLVRGYFFVLFLFALIPVVMSIMPLDLINQMIAESQLGPLFANSNFINRLLMRQ